MKVHDVVGYAADADVWCTRCLPYDPEGLDGEGNPVAPVFAGSAWDYQPVCGGCGGELDVVVIGE